MIAKFELRIDTDNGSFEVVSLETGEIKTVDLPKVAKKTTKKKTTKDESSEPQLTLLDNKYELNSAAVELMEVEPDDRLDIKIKKIGNTMVPVIGTDKAFGTKSGNRLTKSFTVSCRGKGHDDLESYGTIFTLVAHPSLENLFILQGDKPIEVNEVVEDENVSVDDVNIDDIDLDLEDPDAEIEEITTFDFKL